jgi:aspartyl-tRNA(Asn)/glutamyl-tRNA(Gln) amidotransferase subunit C
VRLSFAAVLRANELGAAASAKRLSFLIVSATLMTSSRISIEAVRHVARLAALALAPEDEVRMQGELDAILGHMEELNELDVSGVPPTFHSVSATSALRADIVTQSLPRAELLQAAPLQEAGGFAVPKVLDTDG